MNVPDVGKKREEWLENLKNRNPDKLVFLDESGVNINMTRRYGRAKGGERSVDSAPLSTPANTTILASVRLNGSTVYTTYTGGTKKALFLRYLEKDLLPTLETGAILVMDNMRTHHVKEVQELCNQKGIELLYLPPYSPDFNPIEMMWSKIKAILRKLKARTLDALPDAIAEAFLSVLPEDCHGWFGAANILL